MTRHIPNRIRVLHVIKALGRGGAEVLLREGYSIADPDRVHLEFATLRDHPNDLLPDLRSAGASVHELGCRTDAGLPIAAAKLCRLIRNRRIDLLHAHLPLAGAVSRIAGRITRVPVVYTEHNMPERYNAISALANRWTWRWQDRVIAISRDVRQSVLECYGNGVEVEMVFNGVNTAHFDPSVLAGKDARVGDIPSGSIVIGTVAVFSDTPQKRLDLWIAAVSSLMAQNPAIHALLVGYGSLRSKLEQLAAATGFGPRFHFVGQQADVRPYLAQMDVFLMSSAYEGFGIAPVEAMAMKIPVVATEVSGVREVVSNGHTGILVPFDHEVVEGLAQALSMLIGNEESRETLGCQARQYVQENLSLARMQERLEEVYASVLKAKSANSA